MKCNPTKKQTKGSNIREKKKYYGKYLKCTNKNHWNKLAKCNFMFNVCLAQRILNV